MSPHSKDQNVNWSSLLICNISAIVLHFLPWCFLGISPRDPMTIWQLAGNTSRVQGYLSTLDPTLLPTIIYIGAGLSLSVLLVDLCLAILKMTGNSINIPLDNPSILVPTLFPIIFVVWFLESNASQFLNGAITIVPVAATILSIVGIRFKNQIDNDLMSSAQYNDD